MPRSREADFLSTQQMHHTKLKVKTSLVVPQMLTQEAQHSIDDPRCQLPVTDTNKSPELLR